jgi:hypothetical protein
LSRRIVIVIFEAGLDASSPLGCELPLVLQKPIKIERFRLSAPFSFGQRSLKGGKPRFVLFEAPKRCPHHLARR